jgi:uncharacterized phage protein gp47/JayE
MAYGLTATGFSRKRLQDVQDGVVVALEAALGPINQNPDSAIMQIVGPFAQEIAELWEVSETNYTGLSPQSAVGAQLDGAAELAGITREAAAKSTVVVGLTGTLATVVAAAKQFKSSTTDDVVEVDTSTTIQASNLVRFKLDCQTPVNLQLYRVTIGGVNCDYTSDASATAAEISAGIKAAIDTAAPGMTGTDHGDGTVTVLSDDGETGYSCSVSGGNLIFTEYTTPADCTALNTGVVLVNEGQIDTIVTPVAGLVSVYNYADGDQGRAVETDAELRIRIRRVRRGAATADAIRSRIIDEVDGVSTCLVVENTTDVAVGGQDPHSIHVIVQGGADQDIVDKIWDLKGAGIATYGGSSGTAVDGAGNSHTVYYDRPTSRYGHVRIRYTAYDEETLPVDADDAIQEAILTYGNTFVIGQDMLWQRFLTPVLTTVDGIKSAVVELDHTTNPGDGPTYVVDTDHVVDDDEVVLFDLTRIDVAEA